MKASPVAAAGTAAIDPRQDTEQDSPAGPDLLGLEPQPQRIQAGEGRSGLDR